MQKRLSFSKIIKEMNLTDFTLHKLLILQTIHVLLNTLNEMRNQVSSYMKNTLLMKPREKEKIYKLHKTKTVGYLEYQCLQLSFGISF